MGESLPDFDPDGVSADQKAKALTLGPDLLKKHFSPLANQAHSTQPEEGES